MVRELHAYVPGEQPRIRGLVKLNTNENPYPPSARVLAAVQAATDGRLRLYPNPVSGPLREKLARLHGCDARQVLVGNGSDEILALATRAFVEPGARIQYFTPSYSLYPVLTDIQGARRHPVPLAQDFGMPSVRELRKGGQWDFNAPLTFVTTPNAPSGRGYGTGELDALCAAQKGIVVLDEAYVDFARENAMELSARHPHVLVSRTFSKAYSLCFQRVGYCVGHPALIDAMDRLRDSYNVNGLGQVAALATLGDLAYYRRNFRQIIQTRQRVANELSSFGFKVFPSDANFLLCQPSGRAAREWLEALRARKILVRWFSTPGIDSYLRITIGTDAEMDKLLSAVRKIGAA